MLQSVFFFHQNNQPVSTFDNNKSKWNCVTQFGEGTANEMQSKYDLLLSEAAL